jgi:hypothetical protein
MKSSLEIARYIVSLAELSERVRPDTEEGVWILTAIDQAIKECILELIKLHQLQPRAK